MKLLVLLVTGLLLAGGSAAQTIVRLTQVPSTTPAGATLYLAGSFNNWQPGSPTYAFSRNPNDGTYQLTLPASVTGSLSCKITRGTWETVETDAAGHDIPNREFTAGQGVGTVALAVLGWKNPSAAPVTPACQSTARQPNVQVISTEFKMPQLGRSRRVWVYLPNDYPTAPAKRYPVLYLHDGQNVFDACTSFSGEWGVDETLSRLQQQGLDAAGCLVVAVDHGGSERLTELSPWKNPEYGGGQGDQYVDFLVQTLKPYIDQHYRTLSGREFTGIAGSSMGGLISTYAALKYPQVYSKVGVFSPAFWFADKPLFQYLRQHPANPATRFYFVSGTQESQTMVPLMQAMRDSLARGGVPAANMSLTAHPDGQHAEWFWKREFAAAYQWLLQPAVVLSPNGRQYQKILLGAYPNPVKDRLRLSILPGVGLVKVEMRDLNGRLVLEQKVRSTDSLNVSRLDKGVYILRVRAGRHNAEEVKIVKE